MNDETQAPVEELTPEQKKLQEMMEQMAKEPKPTPEELANTPQS